ncbi:ATP-binding protein [Syntrophothermus lipocalidus]|uniref:AAA ATPase n=1 Tax=Syntrophothermus lipocalidus (strain DSM 12680 / TGB-C1) TaxID=643648 RepID=D7CPE0_SYNLT|nr:ATP-binding protein [Syntrophothermus lipocalidus]ADI02575.1 AAA ATPase [Syntrophothermus lipocalidus DSM 12680]
MQDMNESGIPGKAPLSYQLLAQQERRCDTCGQTFVSTILISPTNLVVNVRGRCRCSPTPDEERAYRLQHMCERIEISFGKDNLLKRDGPKLSEVKPKPGQEPALQSLREYLIREPRNTLLLYGPQGRGKTYLALALARELAERQYSVLALKSIDMLSYVRRSTWHPENGTEVLGLLKQVDLLVIDDIGTEKITDWKLETLYAIIDYRYERKRKATVFTSNLTGKEMTARLGGPITSRICGGLQVAVSGKDWRIA